MDAFSAHEQVISKYKNYLESFLSISDPRIKEEVAQAFNGEGFIPEPLIQFNPAFKKGKNINQLTQDLGLSPQLLKVFKGYNLFQHQVEAIAEGAQEKGFIVTSGTGSGKSLTYIASIFNYLFNKPKTKKGITAILVYPMNALINSQEQELEKFEENFGEGFPITFKKYTGQEGTAEREKILENPPDIILTNYMMLELIMTRHTEAKLREAFRDSLKFLVFDELHTYRGRQGSDVSFLIKRIKGFSSQKIICIGTSATMASEGTPDEKKAEVAKVGKKIFGDDFALNQIIGETLEYCSNGQNPSSTDLRNAVISPIDKENKNQSRYKLHPLVNWIETSIALKENNGVLERGKPLTLNNIATRLSETAQADFDASKKAVITILNWTENLNRHLAENGERKSYLPFRFHQFISQTGVVSVTLEPRNKRKITVNPGRFIKTEDGEKLIFPLLFSRYSGVDFICVEKDTENKKLRPRNIDDAVAYLTKKDAKDLDLKEDHFKQGYIILDEGEEFWQENYEDFLPSSWFRRNSDQLDPFYAWQMPQPIYFDEHGNYHDNPAPGCIKGYYLPTKLRIDPTAGVVYDDTKTAENTKLMRLGNEGRSTATTILSMTVTEALFNQNVPLKDQKLLSFTDNRQDASLQAGHFNDFLATIRLRSGIFYALNRSPEGLNVSNITERLFEVLNLSEQEYAKEPSKDKDFPKPQNTDALKAYLLIRIIQDLKRGWRYSLPNLEQTALINIDYVNLERLISLPEKFNDIEIIRDFDADQKRDLIIQLLNFFRTSYAVDHRFLLDERGETENRIKNYLDSDKLWALDKNERIDVPRFLRIENPGRTRGGIYTASIGARSGFGKYLKRTIADISGVSLSQDEIKETIKNLCELLHGVGILKKKERIKGDRNVEGVPGYILDSNALIWKLGDEQTVETDKTRTFNYKDLDTKPNSFFQGLYKTNFSKFNKPFEGREHTGQLNSEQRIERETRFREGEISTLFCSPTMELGIDIANLNIVHMRNVPPSPANYAQRSGRAGRSGQTALVYTYCSAYSPHDRTYFKNATKMVAGEVVPPRLDLTNEELVKSHFHAFLLMKMELNELNTSVKELIDFDDQIKLPIKQSISDAINHNLKSYGAEWRVEFENFLEPLFLDLRETNWFHDNWFKSTTNAFENSFNESLNRWRTLYKAAKKLVNDARIIIDDPTIGAERKKEAKRQHSVGLQQVDLLENDSKSLYGQRSEFYIFRYLASEGFIPGYNFTRLPIRTFVGWKYQDQGEYISRPKFVALREFGPNNIIYHDGNKYRIERMLTTNLEDMQRKVLISKETGYAFLDEMAENANNDPITHQELSGSKGEKLSHIIDVGESEATPQMRISCEEEERMSQGFEIEEFFSYPQGIESTKQSVIKKGDANLLNLIFGPSTSLIQLNRKWRRSPEEGFNLDKTNGRWLKQKDLEDPEKRENNRKVRIIASNTADTLYIQPLENLGLSKTQIISLSYALKIGIERYFQIEESELGVSVIGNPESPNVLLYEAAEGSLGILSQLIEDSLKLKKVFEVAYEAMHFDLKTREETEEGKSLPKASYDDLLSYYNQRMHDELDRREIKGVLEELMDCVVSSKKEGKDREEQYNHLLESYDKNSSTELKLIQYLYKNCLALPDKAQVNVPEFYISADFVYNTKAGSVLVFCDGSVHDNQKVKEDDSHKRALLLDAGYDIIEWHYTEPLDELVMRRKDIFRKVC